jgi:hypothetical protein
VLFSQSDRAENPRDLVFQTCRVRSSVRVSVRESARKRESKREQERARERERERERERYGWRNNSFGALERGMIGGAMQTIAAHLGACVLSGQWDVC